MHTAFFPTFHAAYPCRTTGRRLLLHGTDLIQSRPWRSAAGAAEQPGLQAWIRWLGVQPDGEKRPGEVVPFDRPLHRAVHVHLDTRAHCQCSRVFPGSATLQRGFWSRAGARRSQGRALVQDLRNGHLVNTAAPLAGPAPPSGTAAWSVEKPKPNMASIMALATPFASVPGPSTSAPEARGLGGPAVLPRGHKPPPRSSPPPCARPCGSSHRMTTPAPARILLPVSPRQRIVASRFAFTFPSILWTVSRCADQSDASRGSRYAQTKSVRPGSEQTGGQMPPSAAHHLEGPGVDIESNDFAVVACFHLRPYLSLIDFIARVGRILLYYSAAARRFGMRVVFMVGPVSV